jgi:hypothetical protein
MHPTLGKFLAKRLPLAGVAGVGVRLADGFVANQNRAGKLPPTQVQAAVERMAAAVNGSLLSRQQPTRLRWDFEKLSLVLALHSSGIGLALFIPRDPNLSFAEINSFLEDFENLDLGAEVGR